MKVFGIFDLPIDTFVSEDSMLRKPISRETATDFKRWKSSPAQPARKVERGDPTSHPDVRKPTATSGRTLVGGVSSPTPSMQTAHSPFGLTTAELREQFECLQNDLESLKTQIGAAPRQQANARAIRAALAAMRDALQSPRGSAL